MNQNKISPKRHIVKTITYRIISTLVGFIAMWWVTGSVKIGTAFGLFELIYKPIQYYIHERVWYRWIKFGINYKSKKIIPIKVEETKVEETKVKKPEDTKVEETKVKKPKDTVKRLNYTRR